MDPLKVAYSESGKGGGSCRPVTRSASCRSPSVSLFSIVSTHIDDDEKHGAPTRGFGASQCASNATPGAIEKLRRDFHSPNTIELRAPNSNENMVVPPAGCMALYPSMFKFGLTTFASLHSSIF